MLLQCAHSLDACLCHTEVVLQCPNKMPKRCTSIILRITTMDRVTRVSHTITHDSHSIVLWEPTAHPSSASNRKHIVLHTLCVEVMRRPIDLTTYHCALPMIPTWSILDCSFHHLSKGLWTLKLVKNQAFRFVLWMRARPSHTSVTISKVIPRTNRALQPSR
jgi:hypothetical protein